MLPSATLTSGWLRAPAPLATSYSSIIPSAVAMTGAQRTDHTEATIDLQLGMPPTESNTLLSSMEIVSESPLCPLRRPSLPLSASERGRATPESYNSLLLTEPVHIADVKVDLFHDKQLTRLSATPLSFQSPSENDRLQLRTDSTEPTNLLKRSTLIQVKMAHHGQTKNSYNAIRLNAADALFQQPTEPINQRSIKELKDTLREAEIRYTTATQRRDQAQASVDSAKEVATEMGILEREVLGDAMEALRRHLETNSSQSEDAQHQSRVVSANVPADHNETGAMSHSHFLSLARTYKLSGAKVVRNFVRQRVAEK